MALPVPVIWLGRLGGFERPWVNDVLLACIPHRNFFFPAVPEPGVKQVIVVFSEASSTVNATVRELVRSFRTVDVLLLSDEMLLQRASSYPGARHFFRAYFSPFDKEKSRLIVPLGYCRGFKNSLPTESVNDPHRRTSPWSFFGQVKNRQRTKMLDAFSSLGTTFGRPALHFTSRFADPGGVPAEVVAQAFDKSVFVPCPRGNINPETFRVMEALERGAIPVVTTFYGLDPYRWVFGEHPFVIAHSWRRSVRKCRKILGDATVRDRKLEEIRLWYRQYASDVAEGVAEAVILGRDFLPRGSEPSGALRIYVRVVYFLHFNLRPRLRSFERWARRVSETRFR